MAVAQKSLHQVVDEELAQLVKGEYADGAAMGTAIDAFLQRQQFRHGMMYYS